MGMDGMVEGLVRFVIFAFLTLIIGGGWYLKSNSDKYKAEIKVLKEQIILCEKKGK